MGNQIRQSHKNLNWTAGRASRAGGASRGGRREQMKGREGRTEGKEEGEERRTEPQNRNHSDRNHQRNPNRSRDPKCGVTQVNTERGPGNGKEDGEGG